jgi:hypothetical protein
MGEQRAREVRVVKGEMDLIPPCLKGRGPFIERAAVGYLLTSYFYIQE